VRGMKVIYETDIGRVRLFDTERDPGEIVDVARAQPESAARYERHFASLR